MNDRTARDIGAAIIDRCELLGLGACLLTPEGRIAGTTVRPRALAALMRTPRVMTAVNGAAHSGVVDAAPKVRIALVAYTTVRGERGRIAALVLDEGFHADPAFAEMCRHASLDPHATRADLSAFVCGGARPAELVRRTLEGLAADALELHERDETIEGFSRQLGESFDTIDLLYSLGRSMHGPFDAAGFLGMVCERLHATMSFSWVAAVFSDAPAITPRLRGMTLSRGQTPVAHPRLREGAMGLLRACGETGTITSQSPFAVEGTPPQIIVEPVRCKGQVAGVLLCGGKHGEDPFVSSYDSQLMEASAGLVTAFADNLALYDDLHASFVGTVRALSAAIDAKDRYTFGHSERVAWMARELALASGLSKRESDRVHIAGLVHDVGKIGVPEGVLCKPGALTPQEFDAVKQHPAIGHRILRDIPGFEDVLPGVLHHHERYDGHGYPAGLAGEDIPLIARLIAVADTFDAMSSNRSYRPAMPRPRVLAEIERCGGSQLDARIASLLRTIDLTGYDELFNARRAEAAQAA
ncbi:MAG: HD-GYP domain-containing protein [Planctomycetota bacterium]|nr:HD-GYP domain-containing protein [Planctomycetota bacterium]